MAETATVDSLDIQITATANKAIAALETLSKRLAQVSASLRETQAALEGQTKAQEEANKAAEENAEETDGVVRETEKMTASTHKAVGGLAKLAKAFGRIMLYRAIRTIIKNIGSAIREGLTNLKEYSEAVGTAFAPAVDNLRQHVLRLKNAFATALRPVIEALIPVIIRLVDWLSKLFDFIAQVMSVLTGKVDDKGRYTKAILSDIEKSNKKAKELRRTLLGFDEINRLDGGTGSSESSGSGLMFEQADVSDKAKKWAEVIKNIIEKVKEIATVVGQFIADNPWILDLAVALFAAFKVLKMFKGILSPILSIVKAIGLKGVAIIAIITAMAIWGDKISAWLDNASKKVKEFFDGFKSGNVVGDSVINIISDTLTFVLDTISLISSAIYKLFHGDFKGALEDGEQILWNALKYLLKLLVNVWNFVAGIIEDVVNALAKAVAWVRNNALAPLINEVATFFARADRAVTNADIDLRIGLLSLGKWILQKFDDLLQSILEGINSLIATMNDVLGTNIKPIDFHIKTDALDAKIDELENKKLPPITETLEVVGKWKDPGKLNLQINTNAAYKAIDNIGQKVNKLGAALSSIIKATGGSGAGSTSITMYASGGFPSVGSLFVAGETGASPELVGNFGGGTQVMNSEQLASALYGAFSAALAANPQGGGDIYLDGEVIYRNTVRRNNNQVRSTGRAALLT